MGGDHKCPVCQATFTRPQHVARHMRSHTGDRPYKCQHCGDQFARSDLLSRHVNKCHAGEKPVSNTGNARRKGTASATRATTSKQACDQCVQNSLPCDGCNPCAKCIQRKCRCTFVKFHRQTAPIGPGHNPRPSGNNSILSSSLSAPSLGGLGISNLGGINTIGFNGIEGLSGIGNVGGINPGIVGSMGLGGVGHVPTVPSINSLSGLGGVGLNGPPLTSIGSLGSSIPLLPAGTTSSGLPASALPSRAVPLYQQNASAAAAAAAAEAGAGPGSAEDFLAVTGATGGGGGSAPTNGEIYTQSQFSFPSVYGSSASSTVNGLGGVSELDEYANKYRAQQAELMRRGSIGHGYSSHHEQQDQQRPSSSHAGSSASPPNWAVGSVGSASSVGSVRGWTTDPESYRQQQRSHARAFIDLDDSMHGHGHGNPVYGYGKNKERRISAEFSDASVSGSGESGSMPNSATSSSVHLPLDNQSSYSHPLTGRHSGSPPNPNPNPTGSRPGTSHGFHNAFGLMSLEDPAVLAGIQNDGTPFFSMMDQLGPEGIQNFGAMMDHSGDPNATPMPDKLQQLHAQAQAHAQAAQAQAHGHAIHANQSQSPPNGGFAHPQQPSSSYSVRPSTGHGYPSMSSYGLHGQMMTPGSREQETKELKDFWKAYMRTPLSAGGGSLTPVSPRGGRDKDREGDIHMLSPGLHDPPSGYRRQRVSSLPTVKTPTPLDESEATSYYGGYEATPGPGDKIRSSDASRSHPGTQVPPGGGPPAGGLTLHNTEDLRSYEAAVLARKAPTNLNLVPRARKSKPTLNGSPSASGSQDTTSPPPPSSANVSSSYLTGTVFQSQSPSESSSFSRESSSSLDDYGSDGPLRRPSFKRLASQTLESQHVKRALLNRNTDNSIGEFDFEDSGSSNSNSASISASVSRPTSTYNSDAEINLNENEETHMDDEKELGGSDQRQRLDHPRDLSIPRSAPTSAPGSTTASPVVPNAFLSSVSASPSMMYGSVPSKPGVTLMQQALMSSSTSGSPVMRAEIGTSEKRRRMSVPTSVSPTRMTFMEAGQL